MAQIIPASALLGPAYTTQAIGYRVLEIDGSTVHSAFTTDDVVESPAGSGGYHVDGGISAPDAGGYIVWGLSGTDVIRVGIEPAAPTVAQINAEVDTALAEYDAPTKAELDTAQTAIIAAQPSAASVVAALMAHVLESGKTVQVAWLDIWALVVGDAVADDANNPTSITYDSPDGSVQITHTLTSTTRVAA